MVALTLLLLEFDSAGGGPGGCLLDAEAAVLMVVEGAIPVANVGSTFERFCVSAANGGLGGKGCFEVIGLPVSGGVFDTDALDEGEEAEDVDCVLRATGAVLDT